MSSRLPRSAYALWLISAASVLAQAPQPASPEIIQHRLNEPQLAVAWSPDGSRVVCSGQNRAIRQFDVHGKELEPLRNGPGGWSAMFSAHGKLVAVCGLDRSVRLWDTASGAEHRQLDGHQSTAWGAAFLPDGRRVISVGEDGLIRTWNADDGKELSQLTGHPGPIWCMAIAADGRWLATGGSDGIVRLWDLQTGRIRRAFESSHSGGVWPIAFSPDGRTIASAGWQDGKILLWETATGKLRRQIPHPTGAKAIAFMPDGCTLITAGNDSVIRFWDLLNANELPPLEGHRGAVNGIAVSPDGTKLASASADNTLRLWDLTKRTKSAKPSWAPEKQIESAWAAILRESGSAAYDAIGQLASCPAQTLALLSGRLQPAPAPDEQKISDLIKKTNDKKYSVREAASSELVRLGEQAEAHLVRVLTMSNPPEIRIRAERALAKLQNGSLKGEALRSIRSVEVLERIGTAEARAIIERLAFGARDARLTMEAQAALKRMSR